MPVNHFSKVPEPVLKSYKQWEKAPSEDRYYALFKIVAKYPRSMGAVKMLFDAAYRTNLVDNVVSYYNSKSKSTRDPDWPYFLLSSAYVNNICSRKKIRTRAEISYSSELRKLPSLINHNDIEARFVLSEAICGFSFYLSRQALTDVVKKRPNDAILHTVLGISYLYGFGPVMSADPKTGKQILVEKETPCSDVLALTHAQKAIKLNPKFSPPYYVAYMATRDKTKRLAFLRKYVELEPDKKSATYKDALKTLAK